MGEWIRGKFAFIAALIFIAAVLIGGKVPLVGLLLVLLAFFLG